jgi:hypothetical protein
MPRPRVTVSTGAKSLELDFLVQYMQLAGLHNSANALSTNPETRTRFTIILDSFEMRQQLPTDKLETTTPTINKI